MAYFGVLWEKFFIITHDRFLMGLLQPKSGLTGDFFLKIPASNSNMKISEEAKK